MTFHKKDGGLLFVFSVLVYWTRWETGILTCFPMCQVLTQFEPKNDNRKKKIYSFFLKKQKPPFFF